MARKAEISLKSLGSKRTATITTDMPNGTHPLSAMFVANEIRHVLASEWGDNPNLVEIRVKVWEATEIVE